MKNYKQLFSKKEITSYFSFIVLILLLGISCSKSTVTTPEEEEEEENTALVFTKTIPIGPNSWLINSLAQDETVISKSGIHNWTSLDDVIRTYVKTGTGELNVGFKMKSSDGASKIKITVGSQSKEITIETSSSYNKVEIGKFNVTEGYNYIEIQGLEKTGTYIGDINDLLLGGTAIKSGVNFVPDTNPHFGRRGPSVHMSYDAPSGTDVQWYYNEVTVPKGEDKLGSFFMVNGHSQGYFGIQVNSETERRILFSIWSAYSTDDPNQVPDEYKVEILGTGDGVTARTFGNEGSGIQSFKNIGWKTDTTYKFLLKGEPSTVAGSTDYTAYFYDPEVGDWKVIASLRRPKTSTYLTGLHSFLENFKPSTGNQTRQVNFGNQWVYTKNGAWTEISSAKFTTDATGRNGDRLDYDGGSSGNLFYLKNCGLFVSQVQPDTKFTRTANGVAPNIDFSKLEKPKAPTPKTLIDRNGWSVVDYSTQEDKDGEGNTGRAKDVLDGDKETYWHSCWKDCTATAPHHITIDMGAEIKVDGVRFLQRQTLSRAVKDIELQMSNDNTNWQSLGNFTLHNSSENIDIDLTESKTFRYLKFIAKASHDGTEHASMAEIMPYTK